MSFADINRYRCQADIYSTHGAAPSQFNENALSGEKIWFDKRELDHTARTNATKYKSLTIKPPRKICSVEFTRPTRHNRG